MTENLKHLPLNSCATADVATARLKKNKPAETAEERRRRIRNRKKLALQNRTVGEDLLRDSFKRAKGV